MNIINNIKNDEILDLVFWLYSNLLGDSDNVAVRNIFVNTQIFKKNIDRCINTSIKIKDKLNSLNLIYNCVRSGYLDTWVSNN